MDSDYGTKIFRLGSSEKLKSTCSRGGVKLLELCGALFNHKDGETGYQDRHRIFMERRKQEVYGLSPIDAARKFSDIQNCRYQCHSYGAAEVITFLPLYLELVEEICASKVKAGANHLEENVLKGLKCPSTIAELAAMAVYGVSVSWPYLREIRSPAPGRKFVNALETVELHQSIPAFCEKVALNPQLILDVNKPTTLDDKPYMDRMIVESVRQLQDELLDLELMVSSMFSGSAKGWKIFTFEFDPENPTGIFGLAPPLRALLGQVPMTNDANEGNLGSLRVYIRANPCSDPEKFSNIARGSRNNTEAFVLKLCDEDDLSFVMRFVREQEKLGVQKAFRQKYSAAQKKRADDTRAKQAVNSAKKAVARVHLEGVNVEVSRVGIQNMNVAQLKDQLKCYKEILHDEVLEKVPLSHITRKEDLRNAVNAALTRSGLEMEEDELEALSEDVDKDSDDMDVDTEE